MSVGGNDAIEHIDLLLQPFRYAQLARIPLAVLNDRIIRIASRIGADVLELRSVCTNPLDFVHQIEPSAKGAARIARAIAGLLYPASSGVASRIFAG